MRRVLLLCAALLALSLAATPALAETDISGQWMGSWTCETKPCKGKKGSITGTVRQKGSELRGGFNLLPDATGRLMSCNLREGSDISDNTFFGFLTCGDEVIRMSGTVNGSRISGHYIAHGLGRGTFELRR
ncbi:MAG: hypothetical protein KQH53_10790 [Desulfarculaceae bacterium]|nr:hypothetical protein [Desulfarculaceae bacterium]